MKKIFITTVFILTLTLGHTQIIKSIGIKSGLTFANQDWTYSPINFPQDKHYKTGLYEALTLEFFNHKHFSLVTDLSFNQKGYKETVLERTVDQPEGTGQYITINSTFNFITLCPMLKYRVDIKSFSPYIFAGPRIDYYTSYSSYANFSLTEKDFTKPIFGLTSGVGIEYKKNKIGIMIEGQYLSDFSHFYKNTVPNGVSLTIDNKAFAVSLGIKYYFGKK